MGLRTEARSNSARRLFDDEVMWTGLCVCDLSISTFTNSALLELLEQHTLKYGEAIGNENVRAKRIHWRSGEGVQSYRYDCSLGKNHCIELLLRSWQVAAHAGDSVGTRSS